MAALKKSQFFQAVGSRFHKKFDQLFDHAHYKLHLDVHSLQNRGSCFDYLVVT